MNKKKRTFFEKLTGASRVDDYEYDEFDEDEDELPAKHAHVESELEKYEKSTGELKVDVLNSPDEIIIKAMVAGVKPQDLDVQISRDVVTIEGAREEEREINEQDYYHRELYWGSFSRSILLPEEIDVELADARERHGMLEIRLPKIDKTKKAKLQVKSS